MPLDRHFARAEPLLVGSREGARLCGISDSLFKKLARKCEVPAPTRLDRRVLWNTRELKSWVDAGCPPREQWESLREAQR